MASLEKRDLADYQTAYRVVWRDDGRKRSATFYDIAEAKTFRAAVERNGNRVPADWQPAADVLAGALGHAARTSPAPTLLQAALAHAESKNTRAQIEHRQKMRRNFERHLGNFGAMPIDTITRADAQQWCDDLAADGYKYKTIKNLRSDVSTVFKFLVFAGAVPANPILGTSIDVDPEDTREPVFLEPWEFDAIAGFLHGEHLVYVETLARTGSGITNILVASRRPEGEK